MDSSRKGNDTKLIVENILSGLTKVNSRLEKLLIFVGLLCLITFISLTGAEIFSRFLLNKSILWSNEISRLTFLWSVYLSAAVGFRHQEHLALDLFKFRPGSKLEKGHEAVIWLLNVLFVILFAIIGVITLQADIARSYPITRISYNWGYASMAVMGVVGTLFMMEVGLRKILGKRNSALSN